MVRTSLLFILPFVFITCTSTKKKTDATTKNQAVLEYKTDAKLGEGAFWNYKTQEFYWIDIESNLLHIYDPKTKKNRSLTTPSRVGTVVPINETEALIALEDGAHKINVQSGEISLFSNLSEELSGRRLNDGKCDPSGRFWVGSMHYSQEKGKARLYSIDGAGNYKTKIDSVTISNGIVWTADKKTMYYIDTPTSQIKAFDFDNATGNISNGRTAVQIPESLGFPDGMAIDEEDMLWVGMWNGNAVIRFNPKTGTLMSKIDVPAHNVTSCAFGGENLDILYITSAKLDMTEEEKLKYPLAGSVFKAVPGVKGTRSAFFVEN